MSQSLAQNYIHIIFSTKNREPFIHETIESGLHAYLGKTCNELQCFVLAVGGYVDHIHILCKLSKNISLAELVKMIKGASSKWIKTQGVSLLNFYWQGGYGAFSVDPSRLKSVQEYIKNQHQHHSSEPFKKEYRALLRNHNVDFDERYVWD